ncbi:hypothetical protein GDO86_019615 [Hymenochirus boettgeri]|uniref:DH domain-containing protein n=1 Tax=Hymenochirus boettgeri TaxID=247094 RepID=A0A8T2IDA5_9PIPI|nr:hypothetical protein GDO86_019615 [Hymenochirus boettgeri]
MAGETDQSHRFGPLCFAKTAGNLNDESPLGIRRILSQSTDSLNMRNRTLSVESLIDEGAEMVCSQLMSDFATDEKEFEADSWSLAVDNNYLQQHKKDVMKRQDVIYELIQTEFHHVRTLKIMTSMFRKGMLEDLQMDPALVQKMFPCVDELSDIHIRFLIRLIERRKDSLAPDSNKNFVISKLGDILINQFSGTNAELMKKAYTEFASQHHKAMKLYKELFSRDKKFQQMIRKMTRSPLLRRHGVQECILLVTQRITKYPVLLERILQNSKGDEEEYQDLAESLRMVKDLISTVDQDVYNNEKNMRLQEIYQRIDSKSTAQVTGDQSFSKEELLRRKLIHEGPLLWKTSAGRFKDIIMLLMTDTLILLQEKDQKYYFPALAMIIQQDTILDVPLQEISDKKERLSRTNSRDPALNEALTKSTDKQATELTLLQRQHTLLQEELRRCRRQCEERAQEAGTLETRLRESEQTKARLEREVEDGRKQVALLQRERSDVGAELARNPKALDPRRRSLPAGEALYQTFTPPQIHNDRRAPVILDSLLPSITLPEESDLKDDFSDLTELEKLRDTVDTESSEEESGGSPTSPSSTREFQRMQDIPEEAESVQDLKDVEQGSSES